MPASSARSSRTRRPRTSSRASTLERHDAPDGPYAAARKWLHHVFIDEDLAAAWPHTDETVRDALADAWPPSEAARDALRNGDTRHALWKPFAAAWIAELRALWGDFDFERASSPSSTVPVALDREMTLFTDIGRIARVEDVPADRWRGLEMRTTADGWLVAGFLEPSRPSDEL